MTINTSMTCREIDNTLKAFLDLMKPENNGKVVYISNGNLTCEDGTVLFDVAELK